VAFKKNLPDKLPEGIGFKENPKEVRVQRFQIERFWRL